MMPESGQLTAKSISIKGAKRRSGGCARKAVELTPGDLLRVRNGLRLSKGDLTAEQKSAEGVVGHDVGKASEALRIPKGGAMDRPSRKRWPNRSDECGGQRDHRSQTMSVFKNGTYYHYEFFLDGRRYRGSTGTANKPAAIAEERKQRERLEKSFSQVLEEESRAQQRKTIEKAADEFLEDYKAKHQSPTYAIYALGHVKRHLGKNLVVEISPNVVKRYQTTRLKEKAGAKTINDEVMLLIRLCGEQGLLIRASLRRDKALKLQLPFIRSKRKSDDALVIHAKADDLKSDPAGNAGDRIACGVITK